MADGYQALYRRYRSKRFGDLRGQAHVVRALRTAVADAPDVRFLLITAGRVADERRAAAHIRSAAPQRVSVWEVPGASHTHGYAVRPDEWRQRVLGFLDGALG